MKSMLLFALSLVSFSACRAVQAPEAEAPRAPRAVADAPFAPSAPLARRELRGDVRVDAFVVELGETVWITGDCWISSREPMRIRGRVVIADADTTAGRVDAPRLELHAPLLIDIPGEIQGGCGRSFGDEPHDGGNGSSVFLNAPYVYIDGRVVAGEGGRGGPGASGGNGGDLHAEGYVVTRPGRASVHVSLTSGRGGDGGAPGGNGGDGGDCLASLSDEQRVHADSLRKELDRVLDANP